jgi:hypothetical protein
LKKHNKRRDWRRSGASGFQITTPSNVGQWNILKGASVVENTNEGHFHHQINITATRRGTECLFLVHDQSVQLVPVSTNLDELRKTTTMCGSQERRVVTVIDLPQVLGIEATLNTNVKVGLVVALIERSIEDDTIATIGAGFKGNIRDTMRETSIDDGAPARKEDDGDRDHRRRVQDRGPHHPDRDLDQHPDPDLLFRW